MRSTVLISAALAALVASEASGQAPGGVGFQVGDKSRIHTNLDLGMSFDSNPDRFATNDEQSNVRATIRPGLAVEVPGTSFSFGLGTGLTLGRYLGVGSGATDTDVGGDVSLNLSAGSAESVVGFRLDDSLTRTPTYISELGTVSSEERRFREWNNKGSAALVLRPGGGALEFDLGYSNILSFYDDLPQSQQHGALLEARLRFLPKTAVVFHSEFSFFSTNDDASTMRSTPYSVSLGVKGQITTRISATISAGFGDTLTWSNGYFSSVSSNSSRSVIGQAELSYALTEGAVFSIGYQRRALPVILLDSYLSDAIHTRIVWALGRLSFGVFGEYDLRAYGRSARNAQILTADARVDFWFTDFLTASVNYRLLRQSADANATSSAVFLEDYSRHHLLVGVGLHY